MGYPYPIFCLGAFLGPYPRNPCRTKGPLGLGVRGLGFTPKGPKDPIIRYSVLG